MDKFLKEFKEFALKGSVIDMAVGVIIGGAFSGIVTAFTDDFITPILNMIGGEEWGGRILLPFGPYGNALLWGHFLSSCVNFLIMALILFLIIQGVTKLKELGKKKEEAAAPAEDPAEIKLMKEMLAIMKETNPDAAKKAEEKLAKEKEAK